MRKIPTPTLQQLISLRPSHLFTRCKTSHSGRRRSSKNNPSPRPSRPKDPYPSSLYHKITEIVGASEEPIMNHGYQVSIPNTHTDIHFPNPENHPQTARRIAPMSKPSMVDSGLDDVSPIVHEITQIVRSDMTGVCMEERLSKSGLTFTAEIVENVLKRCFKVGRLALRFFKWVGLQPGFRHTNGTYNAMIYIAGEAGEFGLMEKLLDEMDGEMCSRDIKTWTMMISFYGKAKQIGKALDLFEQMRKRGCESDAGAYKAILGALCNAGKAELVLEFYKETMMKSIALDLRMYGMLIRCLSMSGNADDVRSVGYDMVKVAKIPENDVYVCMLRSFCIAGKMEEAKKLFEEIEKETSTTDLRLYEVLLKGFCRAGRMVDAVRFVDDIKKHLMVDNKIYGLLIDGFLRGGNGRRALELLNEMRESEYLPTVSTYTQLIQYLFNSDKYVEACELYKEMLDNGIEPDDVVITAMVAGHVRHNRIPDAFEMFHSMTKKGIRPTWKAYSVFIKELCSASKPEVAYELLKEMSDANINATDDIFNLVLSYLTRNGDLEKARKVEHLSRFFKHDSLDHQFPSGSRSFKLDILGVNYDDHKFPDGSKSFKFDSLEVNSDDHQLLNGERRISNCFVNQDLSRSGQTQCQYRDDDLKRVCTILSSSADWSSMQEDIEGCMIHFTSELVEAILRSAQRHGRAALQFFSWIGKQAGYVHTAETYNMAIKISGGGKDFKHMRNLYSEMRRNGLCITPNAWTIMIAQYGQAGLTEIALKTFKEMKVQGYQPDGSTYKYLIVFLCGKKGRKVDEAIKIFQGMINARYVPDKETAEIYISTLCESGKVTEAKSSIRSLCKRGFTRQFGYSLLIRSMCRAGIVEEALKMANDMEQHGCTIDKYMYGSIVHALLRGNRLSEALDKVEAMKNAGISESVHIYTSLIVYFCNEKKIEKAVETFKKMRRDGCEPTVVTYSALIRGYMNMGMVSDAWVIFHLMKLKGPFPDFQTFSMFMTCLCETGKSEEAMQLIHEMLEFGVIPSAINFRTVFHGLNREGKQDLARDVLKTKWSLNRKRKFLV